MASASWLCDVSRERGRSATCQYGHQVEETQQATHRCLDGPLVVAMGWAEVRRRKELAAPLAGQPPTRKSALEVEGSVCLEKRSMRGGNWAPTGKHSPTFMFIFLLSLFHSAAPFACALHLKGRKQRRVCDCHNKHLARDQLRALPEHMIFGNFFG